MKIRTTKFVIKEGISNTYRNKLMSLASLSIIAASLMVLGFFYLISLNISENIKGLKDAPEMEIFCNYQLDDNQVKQVENEIKNDNRIKDYKIVTKKEALEKYRIRLGKQKEILDEFGEDILPVSFIIKLNNSKDNKSVSEHYNAMTNLIESVGTSQPVVDFFSIITNWVPILCTFLLIVLLIISVFIISNTIKLTVFARRREINIMKYIGATDWFIRWPFIVEGVIIGLVGAAFAFIFVGLTYNALVGEINHLVFNTGTNFIELMSLNNVKFQLISIYSLVGGAVGALGSTIAIHKHLHV